LPAGINLSHSRKYGLKLQILPENSADSNKGKYDEKDVSESP